MVPRHFGTQTNWHLQCRSKDISGPRQRIDSAVWNVIICRSRPLKEFASVIGQQAN